MVNNLLERLKNSFSNILVNNPFDYEFLNIIKNYYQFKYEVYYDNFDLLISDYVKFNYDDGLKYDGKINKCVFLIDDIKELRNANLEYKKDLVILIDKNTKELKFRSIYDKDVFIEFYLDNYFFMTFSDSKVKNIFERNVEIKNLKHNFIFNKNLRKVYYFNEIKFNKIFNNPSLIKVNKFIKGVVILSFYQFDDYVIINIINSNNKNIKNVLYSFETFNNLEVVGIFEYEESQLIDYYLKYDLINELILQEIKRNYFIDFLDIKINKGNLMVRKNRHFF